MTDVTETTRDAMALTAGTVITRHPDRPDETGEWTVTGKPATEAGFVSITYTMADGAEGVFVGVYEQFTVRRTVREQQAITVTALNHALLADLPALRWTLSYVYPLQLDGMVSADMTDEATLAAVTDWSGFLDADMTTIACSNEEATWTRVTVVGEFMGVRFEVWGHVDRFEREETTS